MSFLNQLKIRTKLTVFLLIVALLMVGSGAIELYGLRSSRDALSSVYQDHLLTVNLMNEIRNRQMQIRLDLVTAQKITDDFDMVEQMDRIRSHIFQIQARMEEYSTRTLSPEERTKYEAFVAARKAFGEQSVLPMMDLLTQKEFAKAEKLRVAVMNPTYQKASQAIDALIQHQLDEAKSEYEHVSALATGIQTLSLMVIVGGVALAVLLGFVILRSISQGVSALEKATSRLAAGDLSSRVKTDARDEIGAVADSFNAMAEQFSALISQVRASATQVSGVVNTLSATSDKVATVSRNQTEQAAAAADSIESINAAIGEIARSTDQAVTAANQASGTADRGRQVVTTAVEAIEQVANTVNGASQLVGSLGQRSNQIGQIIQVINDIAEQTNLLALNAAIEAARAGDQGRGFAVVADEVRSLAERTAGATSEIAQMIKAIQNETASVVSSMEQGNRQVGAGVSQAKEALAALSQINSGVHQVVSMIQNIAEATRNQSSATGEITRRVEGIAGLAKDNRSLIEEAAQTAHDLQRLSAGFQETVGRFQG